MEDDFKKDHAGNEGAKSGSTKISFNIKNIINPTGLMLMINIVSIIFWVLHHSYKYIGWINVSSSPRDKNGKSSLTVQKIKLSIKDFFIKCIQIRRKLLVYSKEVLNRKLLNPPIPCPKLINKSWVKIFLQRSLRKNG